MKKFIRDFFTILVIMVILKMIFVFLSLIGLNAGDFFQGYIFGLTVGFYLLLKD